MSFRKPKFYKSLVAALALVAALSLGSAFSPARAASATNSGIDTGKDTSGNPIDLMFAVDGQEVGDWSQTKLKLLTGLSLTGAMAIGTTAIPASELDVYGNASVGSSYAGVSAAPANGMIVQGKTGIGTTTPQANLDVGGDVRIGQTSDTCTATNQGALKFQPMVGTTPGYYLFCNGVAWVHIVGGTTNVISNPVCGGGACQYNSTYTSASLTQFCINQNQGYTGYSTFTASGSGCNSCRFWGLNTGTGQWQVTAGPNCNSCQSVATVTCQ